jgi:hypothetical protein
LQEALIDIGLSGSKTIKDTSLISFTSAETGDTTVFHTDLRQGPTNHDFDFNNNVYYIEVVLTRPDTVAIEGYAPAISSIQLVDYTGI